MKIRAYTDEDFMRIERFISGMFRLNSNSHCWLPARWEYAMHLVRPLYIHRGHRDSLSTIRIYETDSGSICGIVLAEDTSNAFILIHPDCRYLEEDMVVWAEENIALPAENGKAKTITFWVNDSDLYRQNILNERGYTRTDGFCFQTRQGLNKDIPQVKLPEGYFIKTFADGVNVEKKLDSSAMAFGSQRMTVEIYKSMQQAPMYRPDLDIVIQLQDGTVAAFCTVWYDKANRLGMFEPVGTHPEHQRKGLGQAVLYEGMRRLKQLGAENAYVEAYGEWRGDFYKSAGFVPFDKDREWTKIF